MPVAVLTSRDDTLTEAGFYRAGASYVLHKPFRDEEVNAMLECAGTASPVLRQDNGHSHELDTFPDARRVEPDVPARALRWLAGSLLEARDQPQFCQELQRALDDLFGPVRAAILLRHRGQVSIVSQRAMKPEAMDSWDAAHRDRLLWMLDANPAIAFQQTEQRGEVKRCMNLLGVEVIVPLMRFGEVAFRP